MSNVPMLDLTTHRGAKDIAGVWRAFNGMPVGQPGVPTGLREFGHQPADEAWVYACMTIRSDNIAGVPCLVQVRDGDRWVPLEGKSDSAGEDLQRLLDDVNPAWEGASLQAFTDAGASIHGGSYWQKVRGRLGGPPQELHWLSGADVEPVIGSGPFPTEYLYRPAGQGTEARYPAKDVIAFRETVNLENPYRLLSPLSAARYEIATNKRAGEWNAALLENWGIPAGAWVAAPGAEMTPQNVGFIKRALRQLRGPGSQGKTPVLPAGLTFQPLSMNQKDADWISSRKVARMTVCAALGVPLVLAGDDEKAAVYASVRDAERVMWRLRLIPSMDRRASRIDSWLVPDFDKTRKRLRVRYDYSGIEALRAAPAEDQTAWQGWIDRGLPLNRAVSRFGMGGAVEGGDEPRFKPDPVPGAPRPAEYQVTSQTGNERKPSTRAADVVRLLGKRLYQDTAVKAFLASDDHGRLDWLGPFTDSDRIALADGLRRRYSADQLLSGVPSEGYASLSEVTQ